MALPKGQRVKLSELARSRRIRKLRPDVLGTVVGNGTLEHHSSVRWDGTRFAVRFFDEFLEPVLGQVRVSHGGEAMKTVEIKCDGCGGDLTDAGAMPTYRLELAPQAVANSGNIIYSVAVQPDINRSYHFCGLACLDHWRGRERHRDGLWRAWSDKWRDDHGTKDTEGNVRSWPSAPEEVREARKVEFDAAALEAFPMKRPGRR